MATRLEYALVGTGIFIAITAVVFGIPKDKKTSTKPSAEHIVMVKTWPTVAPRDLGILLVPDLSRAHFWDDFHIPKK